MGTKTKRNIWVCTPSNRFWEFLSVPNFKSLAILSTVGLMTLGSATAKADDYAYGRYTSGMETTQQAPNFQQASNGSLQMNALNPNAGMELEPPNKAYIGANARLEDTRPLVQNYSDENIIPMNQRPGYFMEDGGSRMTEGGTRPR